jgi:hypothetical protein
VQVDYSVEIEGLVFSLGTSETNGACTARSFFSTMQSLALHQQRLAEQARPAQLKLLRRFGDSLPEELQAEKLVGGESADSIDFHGLANRFAEEAATSPDCICGMQFERVSSHERAVRWCQMNLPDLSPGSQVYQELLRMLSAQSSSYCDLCNESIPAGADLWTCQNGNSTILHSNAFDFCDRCLVSHSLNLHSQ